MLDKKTAIFKSGGGNKGKKSGSTKNSKPANKNNKKSGVSSKIVKKNKAGASKA